VAFSSTCELVKSPSMLHLLSTTSVRIFMRRSVFRQSANSGKKASSTNCSLLVKPTNMARKSNARIVLRYLCLGAGVAGVARLAWVKSEGHYQESSHNLRALALTLISVAVGYVGHRYIMVAHCESPEEDKLDEALKKVNEKVEEAKQELKEAVDAKVEELWLLAKEKYISPSLQEAFDLIEKIQSNLMDFAKLNTDDFTTPVPILLALIRKVQDKLDRDWLATLPKESEVDEAAFDRHRRIAHLACSIYDASLTSNVEKQVTLFGLDSEDSILATGFDGGDVEHGPCFAVLQDEKTDAVVLVVRGTFSLTDVVIDIVCDDEDFLGGYAHR